jgi:hypothetical protein
LYGKGKEKIKKVSTEKLKKAAYSEKLLGSFKANEE